MLSQHSVRYRIQTADQLNVQSVYRPSLSLVGWFRLDSFPTCNFTTTVAAMVLLPSVFSTIGNQGIWAP